jgi:hypothetical protein
MALTGRFTFRRSFWGRIVLQVEEEKKSLFSRSKPMKKRWRDATLMDLAAPELRPLIDLRYKPHFMAQHDYLSAASAHQPLSVEGGSVDGASVPRALADAKRANLRVTGGQDDVTVEIERAQRSFGLRQQPNRTA